LTKNPSHIYKNGLSREVLSRELAVQSFRDKDRVAKRDDNPFEISGAAKGEREQYYNTKESLASRLQNEQKKREPVYRNSGIKTSGVQAPKTNNVPRDE
jgi:hypothetical protein